MIVFLAESSIVRRCLFQVMSLVPLEPDIAERPEQVPTGCRRVLAVGGASRKLVLALLEQGTEVIDVTDGIWGSIALAESSERVLGIRNLTLPAAASRLHDEAKYTDLCPEGLRDILEKTVRPLVELGYLQQAVKDLLEDWASWVPSWTDEERARVAGELRRQSNELKSLSIAKGGNL